VIYDARSRSAAAPARHDPSKPRSGTRDGNAD
jgi:hypothetical protein